HLNTDNIHNHFVVNSVSFKTGRKFRNGIGDRLELRKISDAICAERNKSVIQGNKFFSNKKEYWIKKNGGMTHRDMLRKDIDSIIKNSTSWSCFKENLKGLGYKIVRDDNYEHITIIADGWKRPVRLDSLGANYTIEAIEKRLAHNRHSENSYFAIYRAKKSPLLRLERELEFEINHSHDTATVLIDTVFYIILQLLKLTRDIDAWGEGGQAHSPLLREGVTFERQLEKEYFFLKDHGLRTVSDVTAYCREKESEITELEAERSKVRNSNRRPKTSQERQEKLQAAREITNKINPLREQLKIADSALERFPKVWDLLKTEHDIEINAPTKTKEKGLNNNEKHKENYCDR
ncbi:MAG: relaxase/mobilization nuclease domain-containing protein, partial [Acutalibacteraceae bacterium]|nr:relaxase/mobilization nuclease domain-containing protein [Acutalibacteraceae bacterium]